MVTLSLAKKEGTTLLRSSVPIGANCGATTAAKAFGTLANGLPEDMLGDVLPWLFTMLRSSESAVERSGAAHGLSEVLMAMGMDRIEQLLPDILDNARNKDAAPEVREGYLGLFVYLPVAMGIAFEPYLTEVMETLLQGIADSIEGGKLRIVAPTFPQGHNKWFTWSDEVSVNFGMEFYELHDMPTDENIEKCRKEPAKNISF